MPQFLDTRDADFDARFAALLEMKREDAPDVDTAVAGIIADVRARGDRAVIELTERFDRLTLTPETLAFTTEEIAQATQEVPAAERAALELAATRIRCAALISFIASLTLASGSMSVTRVFTMP